jgi:hypothetical protein
MDPSLGPRSVLATLDTGMRHTRASRCHFVPFTVVEPGFERTIEESLPRSSSTERPYRLAARWPYVGCQVVRRQASAKYVRVFFAMQLPGFAAPYLISPPDRFSVPPTTRLCPSDGQMEQWAAALTKVKTTELSVFVVLIHNSIEVQPAKPICIYLHLDVDFLKSKS